MSRLESDLNTYVEINSNQKKSLKNTAKAKLVRFEWDHANNGVKASSKGAHKSIYCSLYLANTGLTQSQLEEAGALDFLLKGAGASGEDIQNTETRFSGKIGKHAQSLTKVASISKDLFLE